MPPIQKHFPAASGGWTQLQDAAKRRRSEIQFATALDL
jgi:hypothetical protein